jgi:hypothetical protein
MLVNGREYSLLKGSDIARDGMFLELSAGVDLSQSPLAEWFYSDVDGSMSLTLYATDLDEGVLTWFQLEANRQLAPSPRAG